MATEVTKMQPLAGSLVELYIALDRVYQEASKEIGLSPQQAQLLCAADWKSPALGELADALNCDKTNITGLADRVERLDLVERVADPDDRRVTRLEVTEKGKELISRLHAELNRRLEDGRFSGLPDSESITRMARKLLAEQGSD